MGKNISDNLPENNLGMNIDDPVLKSLDFFDKWDFNSLMALEYEDLMLILNDIPEVYC